MDVLAVVLACSLYPDDELLQVLVEIQSGANKFFVGDLATLETSDRLTTVADALRVSSDIEKRGGRPAVGLTGIPISWAANFAREPSELFDPCVNVAIASAALAEYYDRCASPPRHTLRRSRREPPRSRSNPVAQRACVLSHFGAELGVRAAPAAVLKAIADRQIRSAAGPSEASLPHRSEIISPDPSPATGVRFHELASDPMRPGGPAAPWPPAPGSTGRAAGPASQSPPKTSVPPRLR